MFSTSQSITQHQSLKHIYKQQGQQTINAQQLPLATECTCHGELRGICAFVPLLNSSPVSNQTASKLDIARRLAPSNETQQIYQCCMWEDRTQLASQTRCQVIIPCWTFHLIIYAWYPLLGFWHKVHITDTADQLLDVTNNQLHLVGQEAAAEAGGFNTDNLQRPSTTQIRSWAAAAQEARLRHATYNSSSSPASATAAIESTGCSSTRIV